MRKIYSPKIKKFGFFAFVLGLLFSLMPGSLLLGQTVVVTNPTSPWQVPAGVTSIKVEAWGGGGGGASGGGGGGGYASKDIAVTQGQTFTITVGSGGIPGGADGGNSSFSNLVVAGGGKTSDGGNSPGPGGVGITGTTLHTGGSGGKYNYSFGRYSGGGGGGSAFNNANGNNGGDAANYNTSGVGGTGTGNGGNGASRGSGTNAADGVAPGGGGGGRSNTSNLGSADGAKGRVVITYTISTPPTITSFTPNSGCANTTSVVITGTNFTGATSVKFGGTNAGSFTINSSTKITAVPAAGTTGAITVTAPGGTGTSSTNFTVNPLPTVAPIGGGAAVVCIGGTSPAFTDATTGGTWSITNGTGSASISSAGVATGISAGTVTVVYTYNDGNCSNSVSTSLNVNPLPTASAGGTKTICQNQAVTVSGATSSNGTILWTSNGAGTLSGATTLTPTYTSTAGDAGNAVTLTMTVTSNNACSPATATAAYTVNVTPQPTAVSGGSQTICQNGTATVSGATSSNGTIVWTENGAGSITAGQGTLTPTYTAASGDANKTVALTMTVSNSPCAAATATYSVIVSGTPTASAGGSKDVCVNQAATVSGANATNGTILWTSNGAGTLTNETTKTPTYTPAAGDAGNAVTLTMTVSNSPCADATATYTVNVKAIPTATAGGSATICQNGTATVSGATSSNGTIVWTENGVGSITSGQGTLTPTYTAATGDANKTVALTMTVSNSPCAAATATYSVIVSGTPTAGAGGNKTICADGTATVSGATANNGTILWTTNGGGTLSDATTLTPTYTAVPADGGNTVTLTMTVSNSPCADATATYTVNVKAIPTATAGGSQDICEDGTATVSGASATNGTILWTEDGAGSIISGANTLTPTYKPAVADAGNTVTLTMTVSNSPCTAVTATYSVKVNPLPTATIGGTTTVCQNDLTLPKVTFTGAGGSTPYIFTYKIGNGSPQTVSTQGSDISVDVDAPTDTKGVFTYTLISVQDGSSTACSQNQGGTAVVTVKQPASTTDPADVTTCSTFPSSFTVTATGDDLTYQWYKVGVGALSDGSNISGSQTKTLGIAYTNLSDAGNYYVIVTGASQCGVGAQSLNALLTVYEDAAITIQPVSKAVCSGSDVSFTVAATGTGLNYKWYKGNTPLTDGGNISGSTTETLTITGATSADAASNYNVRISIPGGIHCTQANSQYVKLVVNPIPTVNSVTDKTLCNAAPSLAIGFSGTPASGVTYTWVNDNTAIGLGAGSTGNIATFNGTNTTNTPIIGNITVTPTFTNAGTPNITCTGVATSFKITVNPTATVDEVSDQVKCNDAMTDAINFTSPSTGGTITYNWTNNTPSIGLAGTGTGNISSFAAVNTTANPITATIKVTPSFANVATCSGTQLQFTITVNPTPKLSSSFTPPAICNNAAFSYNPTSLTTGATFSWSRAAVPGISNPAASSTVNANPNETLNNTTADPITVIYEYTISANGCSNTQDVSVVVNPTPTLTSSLTPTDVCSGSLFTYNAASATGGTSFGWTRAVVAGISNGASSGTTSINETLINTSGVPVNVTYVYTLTANGCSNTQNVLVLVNPTVTIAPLTQDTVCNNGLIVPIGISGLPAGSMTWSYTAQAGLASTIPTSGSGTISGSFSNTTVGVKTVTFKINTVADNTCPSTSIATVIVRDSLKAPNISATQVLCPGSSPTPLTINPGTGSGTMRANPYKWIRSSDGSTGWTGVGTGSSYTPPATSNYYALVVFNDCESDTSNVVQISTADDFEAGISFQSQIPTALCSEESFDVSLLSLDIQGSILGNKDIRFNWKSVDPGFYSSSTLNPFGDTHSFGFWIFKVYWFTGDAGFTVHNNTPAPVKKDLAITPVVLNPDNSVFCNLTPKVISITINPVPVITDKTATSCTGEGFSVTPLNASPSGNIVPSGTLYSWSKPSVPGISGTAAGANQTSISGTLTNTTNAAIDVIYVVTPKVGTNGCGGNPFNVTVTVNPTPKIPDQTGTICSGSTFTFTPTNTPPLTIVPSGTKYSWSAPSVSGISGTVGGSNANSFNSGTLVNSTSLPVDVNYTVTAKSGTCAAITFNIKVTVNPKPVATITADDATVCEGSGTTIHFSGTPNAVISYTFNGSPTNVTLDNSGIASLTTGNLSAAAIYALTGAAFESCNNGLSGSVTVNVNPTATSTISAGTSPICKGLSSTISFTGTPNTTVTYNDGVSDQTVTLNSSGSATVNVTPTSTTIYNLVNVAYSNTPTCSQSLTGSATITISPDANSGTVTGTTPLCINAAPVAFSNNGADPNGTWNSSDETVASVDASGNVIALKAGPTTISYLAPGCNGVASTLDIVVSKNATAGTITGNDNESYCVGSFVYLSSDGDGGGTWSSGDESIATVDNSGKVTSVGPGTVIITYTVTGGCNPPSSTTTSIKFINASAAAKPNLPQGPASSVCGNSVGNIFTVDAVTDANAYVWSLPPGWTITSSNNQSNNITVKTSLDSGRISVIAVTACGAGPSSDELPVVLHNVWKGRTSTVWNLGTNWNDGQVADMGCGDVYIPSTSNQPTLGSGSAAVGNLHILSGATLTVSSATMQIAGAIDNQGTFDASQGTLELNGTNTQTIDGSKFITRTVENLIVSNDDLKIASTPNDTLNVTGLVSFGTVSAKLNTGDNLTLKSTKDTTASIGTLGSGNSVSGKVEVERYINIGPGGHSKTWQFLATPTGSDGNGQTFKQSWMEGGSTTIVGYGAQFTGKAGIGYDGPPSVAPSVKSWDVNLGGWKEFSNTALDLYDSSGYFAFVRGDRSVSGLSGNTTPKPTTLRSKGNIFTGDKTFNAPIEAPDNIFFSIGNPYPSAVDMTKVDATVGTETGPLPFFYVWTPGKSDGYYNVGSWSTYTLQGNGHYKPTPYYGTESDMIQSGQAFLIQLDGTNSTKVTFNEDDKVTSSSNIAFRGQTVTGKSVQLITNLLSVKADGSTYLADGTLQMFDKSYTDKLDRYDATKIMNSANNFSIKTSNVNLVVERRAPLTEQDTIQYNMASMAKQSYRLEFKAQGLSSEGVEGFVEDNFLNTRTALNMEGTTDVDFAVTSDKASYATNRFRIVFKTAVVLPVKLVSVTAVQKDENIQVDWKVENEQAVKGYEVEKSIDGVSFKKAYTVAAANNGAGSYQWLDEQATPGYNYYRIRIEEQSGQVSYSDVVKVLIPFGKPSIGIYPNPITDGIIHLQMVNQPQGRYGIRLLNPLGQTIIAKQIEHAGGNATENIKWNYNLAHGVYQLEVLKPGGKIQVIKVMY